MTFSKAFKTLRAALVLPLVLTNAVAIADSADQARRMHNRIAGVPPTPEMLKSMQQLIDAGKPEDAAMLAIENPYFYNLTLKNWFTSWSNEDVTVRAEFNDMTATMIGIVRDNIPFDQALYGDIIYTGTDGLAGVTAYAPNSNAHYQTLETTRTDLKANLVKREQSTLNNIEDTAGVITTRAFGSAFFTAGTNRAALRFTFMNFLCRDLEQMSDTTIADYMVRRDVDRRPGGDSKVFRTKCAGCHAGMDGLTEAFAYFDFVDGRVTHTPGTVVAKYGQNADTFPQGHVTPGDGWINLWTRGQNAKMGWKGAASGNGAREYGMAITQTDAFPQCMAERVFENVCLHKPTSADEIKQASELAEDFEANSYSMKRLFAKTAAACIGE